MNVEDESISSQDLSLRGTEKKRAKNFGNKNKKPFSLKISPPEKKRLYSGLVRPVPEPLFTLSLLFSLPFSTSVILLVDMQAALEMLFPRRSLIGRGWSWRWFWRSGETTEKQMEERSAFRAGFERRIWFSIFQISGAPSTAAARDSVGQPLHHRSTLGATVSTTEERWEVLLKKVLFSGSRIRRVLRSSILGVVNRWWAPCVGTRWSSTS